MDWITISGSGAGATYKVTTNDSSSSRTGVITFTQGESGKTCTLTIVQEAKDVYEFYITDSEGNGHYTDFTFSAPSNGLVNKHVLNLISTHNGSPLPVDSVEGKITVNSIQSTTKDRGIGDNVYVWAYNSVRGLWLSIGNFRIEEGTNMHHWDVSWPT